MRKLLEELYPDATLKAGFLSKITLENANVSSSKISQVSKYLYTFAYLQGDGTQYIFKISILENGGFNIVSTDKIVPQAKA